jgi:aspartyl-tRNA(Asn)/glutamyl-tRNA(Gln) amidotransferase subunit C
MAKLDRNTIHYLTSLCRIRCTEEEEEIIFADLGKVLHYMDLLNSLDTTDVQPLHYVTQLPLGDTLRDDTVEPSLSREEYLADAPAQVGGMIRVPPVLKQN